MRIVVTKSGFGSKSTDIETAHVQYLNIELEDGTKYDIEFKFGELYIRKTGSHLSDEINIVPKASNVISLK